MKRSLETDVMNGKHATKPHENRKTKKDMIKRLLKEEKNRMTESSPQILRAKTAFNTRELGTRSKEKKPGSPFLILLLVTVSSVA